MRTPEEASFSDGARAARWRVSALIVLCAIDFASMLLTAIVLPLRPQLASACGDAAADRMHTAAVVGLAAACVGLLLTWCRHMPDGTCRYGSPLLLRATAVLPLFPVGATIGVFGWVRANVAGCGADGGIALDLVRLALTVLILNCVKVAVWTASECSPCFAERCGWPCCCCDCSLCDGCDPLLRPTPLAATERHLPQPFPESGPTAAAEYRPTAAAATIVSPQFSVPFVA